MVFGQNMGFFNIVVKTIFVQKWIVRSEGSNHKIFKLAYCISTSKVYNPHFSKTYIRLKKSKIKVNFSWVIFDIEAPHLNILKT